MTEPEFREMQGKHINFKTFQEMPLRAVLHDFLVAVLGLQDVTIGHCPDLIVRPLAVDDVSLERALNEITAAAGQKGWQIVVQCGAKLQAQIDVIPLRCPHCGYVALSEPTGQTITYCIGCGRSLV